MSENTNTAVAENVYIKDVSTGQEYIKKEGFKILKNLITKEKSPIKGCHWHSIEVETPGVAIERYGEGTVTDLINQGLRARTYTKIVNGIKSELPAEKSEHAAYWKKVCQHPELFGVEDALSYKPGERDQSPVMLGKKLTELFTANAEAARARDLEKMNQISAQINEVMAKIQALAKEQTELVDELAE